jgi:hypothetical protein
VDSAQVRAGDLINSKFNSEEIEFFCPTKEVAFAVWHDEIRSGNGISTLDGNR